MLPVQTPTNEEALRPPVTEPSATHVDGLTGQFLSLTSYKRDTSGVATPVWFAEDGGRLIVMTDAHSGKVKRIRRDPYVEIAPCSARGKVRSAPMPAHAVGCRRARRSGARSSSRGSTGRPCCSSGRSERSSGCSTPIGDTRRR